jgi:repressor LexA
LKQSAKPDAADKRSAIPKEEFHEQLADYGKVSEPAISRVKYYDDIAAGHPSIAEPPLGMPIEVPFKVKESWYALRVSGDSMTPEYRNGDIVLMDSNAEPRKGDVVAALIDGTESTLKRYSQRGDEITLTPVNTAAYEPKTYHANRVTVQGVLVKVVRRAN